jgi:outer membrane protein assembly factor BamC
VLSDMRSAKIAGWLLLLWVTLFASGCSYVKSLFPDKERDYQFRGEIPELIIPDDLKPQNQASKIPGPPSGAVASVPTPVAVSAPVAAPVQPVPSAPLAVANVPTVFPEANAPAPADAWPPARDEAARPAGQQPVVSNFASQPSLSAKTGVSSLKKKLIETEN